MTRRPASKVASTPRFIWPTWQLPISLVLLPTIGFAGTDGAQLLARCDTVPSVSASSHPAESSRTPETAWCEGYIAGLSESHDGMGYCRRTQAERSPGFEREAVQRYLTEHRDRLHEPADTLVLDALRHAFPCLR
jgi:hypothetical protein